MYSNMHLCYNVYRGRDEVSLVEYFVIQYLFPEISRHINVDFIFHTSYDALLYGVTGAPNLTSSIFFIVAEIDKIGFLLLKLKCYEAVIINILKLRIGRLR